MGRRPIGKVAMSGAERQRRYQDKLAEGYDIGPLKDHIRELQAELARSAKQRADGAVTKHSTGSSTGRIRELEADVRLLKDELARERAQRKAAEAKASPPDKHIAQLEAMLIAKVRGGSMRFDEFNKLLMVAHTDRKPSDSEKNEAFRLLMKMKPHWVKDAKKRAVSKAARTPAR